MAKKATLTKQGRKLRDAEDARLRDDRRRLQRAVRDQKRIAQLARELKRTSKRAGDELMALASDLLARQTAEERDETEAAVARAFAGPTE